MHMHALLLVPAHACFFSIQCMLRIHNCRARSVLWEQHAGLPAEFEFAIGDFSGTAGAVRSGSSTWPPLPHQLPVIMGLGEREANALGMHVSGALRSGDSEVPSGGENGDGWQLRGAVRLGASLWPLVLLCNICTTAFLSMALRRCCLVRESCWQAELNLFLNPRFG